MAGTLVGSNVILDVLTEDARWYAWSSTALAQCADEGALYINPIIYAEVSIAVATIEEMEEVLPAESFPRLPIPLEAAFLAGKAFLRYRKRKGTKITPLPDFFIGAHAAVAGLQLLTRDTRRYRTYFPSVAIIAPVRT
jgi:predicted nucleic acid-binding protein